MRSPASGSSVYVNGEYLSRHPNWHEEDSAWKAAQITRLLRRHDIVPRRVCEVGCGSGGVLARLESEWGTECVFDGYDISPQALALCLDKATARLRFHLLDFVAVPSSSYDVILLMDVIEHIEDPFSFLREIAGRGRYKVLHIPLDLSLLGIVTRLPERVRVSAGHLHFFTKELALDLLKDCGLRVVDAVYTSGSVDLPPKTRAAALARVPRALCYKLSPEFTARFLGGCSLLVLAE